MSVVGVPGEASNSAPPTLLIPALAAWQCGLGFLLQPWLHRVLLPGRWSTRLVDEMNRRSMTIYCTHQLAALGLTGLVVRAHPGDLPGLLGRPDHGGWLVAHLAWLPAYLLVLVVVVRLATPVLERRAPRRPVSDR